MLPLDVIKVIEEVEDIEVVSFERDIMKMISYVKDKEGMTHIYSDLDLISIVEEFQSKHGIEGALFVWKLY